jgi:RNA polymerase sigma-70 factor (ECF subfamily)
VTLTSGAEIRAADSELMQRIAERDETALAAVYDRYGNMVFSTALRVLRDTAAAEDILQETFYGLWEKAAMFQEGRGSLGGWLLVMARNRAISRLRRKDSAPAEDFENVTVRVASTIEADAAQKQMIGRVQQMMQTLPEGQREALELAFFEGLTHSEIAQKTGQPLGTIKTRVRAALDTLRQSFHA